MHGARAEVEIRQKWFLADGSSEPSDDDKTWFCPVIVGTDKGSSPAGFLEEKSGKIACASCLPGLWELCMSSAA